MKPLPLNNCRAILSALETLYDIDSIRPFPDLVFSVLKKFISYDAICYNEVSFPKFDTIWFMEPVNALPLPNLREAFENHMSEHPVFSHYVSTGDEQSFKLSDFFSQRQFHDSALYYEFYKPTNVEYQLGTTILTTPQMMIGAAIDRSHTDFSENDRVSLNLIRPHLVQAYNNRQILQLMKHDADKVESRLLTIGRSGEPVTTDDETWQLLEGFFDTNRSRNTLPQVLKSWINHERARFCQGSDIPSVSTPLVLRKENRRITVRFLWGGADTGSDSILIEEEPVESISVLARTSKLTDRESEILTWLSRGKTNNEISEVLSISPLTVKKHLEHIYSKLQVHRRSAAVAQFFRL